MPDHRERPVLGVSSPSQWVSRFLPAAPAGQDSDADRLLDLAAGGGRHALLARSRGWQVVAVDRSIAALTALEDPGIDVVATDLEVGDPRQALLDATGGRKFGAVIVANYLHRPLLAHLAGLLAPDGRLIYETFMDGNAAFGKPSNPDFLLRRDELLEAFAPLLTITAFEQGFVETPTPRMVQRLCAIHGAPVLPQ